MYSNVPNTSSTLKWLSMLALALMMMSATTATANPKHKKKHNNITHQLRRHLYSPEQIIRHSDELKLTDAQSLKIRQAMKQASNRTIDLRFELHKESKILTKMVAKQSTNAKKVLAQADKVMALESKIKRTTLQLMLTVKNVLTKEQIAKIEEHRQKQRHNKRRMMKRRRGPF